MQYFWIAVVVAVMGTLWWVGYRMEPHWVSKDGQRFMCGTQEYFHGHLAGHPRETQCAILADGTLHVTNKKMLRRQRSIWNLIGKSDAPPKNLEIYVAQRKVDGNPRPEMLALRIPKKSKCVAALDAQLIRAGIALPQVATPASPETSSPEGQPDQD